MTDVLVVSLLIVGISIVEDLARLISRVANWLPRSQSCSVSYCRSADRSISSHHNRSDYLGKHLVALLKMVRSTDELIHVIMVEIIFWMALRTKFPKTETLIC